MKTDTLMEDFLFDLHGYTLIPGAIDADSLQAMNGWVDTLPPLKDGDWFGHIKAHTYGGTDGMNLQFIFDGGEIFERLIDNPAWIGLVRRYLGEVNEPYINEEFLNVRGQGGYIGVHSGGWRIDGRLRAGGVAGHWCTQFLSVIVALNDIGPGDGPTVIIPGSHKSAFAHPQQADNAGISKGAGDTVVGAEEVYLKAGDAVLFTDMLIHGSATRTNAGNRRTIVLRYLPATYAHRWRYVPSPELVARLTPERRKIIQPVIPVVKPD
jgi:hypothetical protein